LNWQEAIYAAPFSLGVYRCYIALCYIALSTRNQLQGRIAKITLRDIMAHVVVEIGKHTIESVITRQSAKEMKLKKGDKVGVVIKSTEVMLKK
jgi:molybdopterin-binding protein